MRRKITLLALLGLLLLATTTLVQANSNAGYTLSWWTVDGGGVTSPPGTGTSPPLSTGYSLSGTVGQPDAATWQGDDGYTLSGGFWFAGSGAAGYEIFLPMVVRDWS